MIEPTLPKALGLEPSFGFGDRLGCATPGHIEALREAGDAIKGIFAQQSIREMTRTARTPNEVMTAATQALAEAQFSDTWGADADHLKTREDVESTAEVGFVFFTIDPSDVVDQQADNYEADTLQSKFQGVQDQVDWLETYQGKTIEVPDGPTIEFDEQTVLRAAVKYGPAIGRTLKMAQWIKEAAEKREQPYEIELSVDETEQPTTLAEHYIIADQLARHDVKVVSLAPRYIGEFEKGVDYKGDLEALEASLKDHAAIARALGPYKLSLHSGSDKLSMYPAFARATQGQFHVKTAGTSYLEALRVILRHDEDLFRRIVDFSRAHYNTDKATYHVSASISTTPPPEALDNALELETVYLERWEDVNTLRGFTEPGRQILHCTFGSVVTDSKLGPEFRSVLENNPTTYCEVLADHFARHLHALREGL